MQSFLTIAGIAVMGAAGTLARYGLSGLTHRLIGTRFAWGTLAVNLLGCLVLGFLMQAVLESASVPRAYRQPLTIGFCGAFTTFSTFGYETLRFIQDGDWALAISNTALNVILGVVMVFAGFVLGRLVTGGAQWAG